MRLILFLLFLSSPIVIACGTPQDEELIPFASYIVSDKGEGMGAYTIFVDKKSKGFLLTTISVDLPNEMSAHLYFDEAYDYEGYYESYITLNKDLVEKIDVYLNYSRTEGKDGVVLCGEGKLLKLSELLKAEKPPAIPKHDWNSK